MTNYRASDPVRGSAAPLAVAIALCAASSAVAFQGTIAGKVYDAGTREVLANITVDAFSITTDQGFSVVTDPSGSYVVPGAPSGVYAFTLRAGGVDYPVSERLDVRVGGPFILESCFTLDAQSRTAQSSRSNAAPDSSRRRASHP